MKKWLKILLIILGILIIIAFIYFGFLQSCTKEAKICPDGTVLGRTGLFCRFPACP